MTFAFIDYRHNLKPETETVARLKASEMLLHVVVVAK